MTLKIISGVVIPRAPFLQEGQAVLDLTSGKFIQDDRFVVFDHRVSGTGAYVMKPNVAVALRSVRIFVSDIGEGANEARLSLGHEFLNFTARVSGRLQIRWLFRHRIPRMINGKNIHQFKEDQINQISFLVIGDAVPRSGSKSTTQVLEAKAPAKRARGPGRRTRRR